MEKKTQSIRRIAYYQLGIIDEPRCGICKHYYRHYNEKGDPLDCGHCVYPRMKHKDAFDLCDYFEKKEE